MYSIVNFFLKLVTVAAKMDVAAKIKGYIIFADNLTAWQKKYVIAGVKSF